MSSTTIKANRQTDYFLPADFEAEINQLQATSAVADSPQTTQALCRWATDQVGPTSDHNLILNSGVILDNLNNLTGVNSLALNVLGIPVPIGLCDVGGTLMYDGFAVAGGTGDVVGPSSAIDRSICIFDTITGKLITDSLYLSVDTVGNILFLDKKYISLLGSSQSVGYEAGESTTGVGNLFLGYRSGKFNTSGTNNVGVGVNTLSSIVALAGSNTAIGPSAGLNLVGGSSNVFLGTQAGNQYTTSTSNICIGSPGDVANINPATYIGNVGTQQTCFIAGILPNIQPYTSTEQMVTVSASGKLGISKLATSYFNGTPATAAIFGAAGSWEFMPAGSNFGRNLIGPTSIARCQMRVNYNFDMNALTCSMYTALAAGTVIFQVRKNLILVGTSISMNGILTGWQSSTAAQAVTFAAGDTMSINITIDAGAAVNVDDCSWEIMGLRY